MKHRGRRRGRLIDLPRATMVQRGVARLALHREASPGVVVSADDPRLEVDLAPFEDPDVGVRTAGVKLHEKLPDAQAERYADFALFDTTGVRLSSSRNDDTLSYLPIQIGKTDMAGAFTEVVRIDVENARLGVGMTPTEALDVTGNIRASGDLKIQSGTAFTATFEHSLASDQTYTLTTGGTVWTSGNDGTGSGLDADLLDGLDSTAFALVGHTHAFTDLSDVTVAGALTGDYVRKSAGDWVNVTITQVLTDLKTVDGTTSGLDADLVDGAHASATPGASTIPIADGGGKLAAGWVTEVLAIADLSDVAAKTGGGTTVVFQTGPTISELALSTYAVLTDQAGAAGAAGRLQRNGAELSWHNGTVATNLEQVARKGAASGYASLDAGTKVPVAQISEVLAPTDLTGVSATTGSGTTLVFNDTPTLLTPTIASFANATHSHLNAAGGGTLDAASIASGTVARARLPGELAYEDEANTFSLVQSFDADIDLKDQDVTPVADRRIRVSDGLFRFTDTLQAEGRYISKASLELITNAEVAAAAGIAYSKLTLTGAIVTADLGDDQVTYAKIQNVSATDKILGRSTVGAGDVEEISCTASGRALLDDVSAAAQRTTLGLGTIATENTPLALAKGGLAADLSATGGASQVLRQSSAGAAVTVSQLAASDLSNGTTGSGGGVVLATAPTITGGVVKELTQFSLRESAGESDLQILPAAASLTLDRILTIDVNDAARTVDLGGNLTTAADLITSGANSLTLTTTGATNVTLPTTGTLAITTQKLDDWGAPDDNVDLNVSTTAHGLTPKLPNDATKYLDGTGAYSKPAGDLVFVATPGDTAINSVTDVTIFTRDVTGVVAGDQLIVEGEFLILNDSAANATYTMHVNFDAAFGYSIITGALIANATRLQWFDFKAVLTVISAAAADAMLAVNGRLTAAQTAAAADTMTAAYLQGKTWDTTALDLTGTVTTALFIKSSTATTTQTLKLRRVTIRKVTPT